ncbi:hypothetical protein [Cellulophaga baltica]|uniref:hypothetical protein n=1 Tax=Cellulophaga baltica TaxID=76594 RepID=UPI00040C05F7|nr:hypothetical protein [Cellulophaga baltica]AIY13722.1 hypothetical protein M667_11150 [Cellulophaga baltica NN016038]
MIEEKDVILREVQQLNELLKVLIRKVNDFESNNEASSIEEINVKLKNHFKFSIQELSEMPTENFILVVKNWNEVHHEKMIMLLYLLITKSTETIIPIDKEALIEKTLLLITLLDEKSKTYSIERVQLKNTLQQWS